MLNLIVKNIDIQVKKEDFLLELTLCNTQNDIYFLEKRFAFQLGDKVLNGFQITNNGEKTPYMGIREKLRPSIFPDDYVDIKPNTCVTLSILSNQIFNFQKGQEYCVNYKIRNSNPISNETDVIEFNKVVEIKK